MLEGMRKATQGAVGKFVMTIVMGLIIVSFVVWGVGDMLRGFTSTTVAKVGSTTITQQQFSNELQSQLYRLQRQLRQPLTAQQARSLGLDAEVLDRMIDEAAFDEKAKALGLGMSDETIAQAVRDDPQLKGADGKFDRARFEGYLRDSGLSERAFFAQQRDVYLRQQIQYALVNGLVPPKALSQALLDARDETRGISYYTLPPAAAGDIPAPGDDVLKTFYEAHKPVWRAPEYRGFDLLAVTPATLAKPGEVSDADAHAAYDKDKATKYTVPEKRKLRQIVLPSEAEANEAAAKIKAGASFDDIAKAHNLSDADTALGETTKAGMFDPSLADPAFALPDGGVSGPLKGRFGYVLLKVDAITPGSVKPFEEVEPAIKQKIATARAADSVQALHDKIEDARGNGKALAEAAKSVGLTAKDYPAIDDQGKTPTGAPADIPEKQTVLRAVFGSDVGVDDEPIATKDGGYIWFSVRKVEPKHDRPFEEVKAKVAEEWRREEIAKRLADKAAQAAKSLDGGADIAELAKAAGVEVKTAKDIKRQGGGGVPGVVAAAVFGVGPTGAGSAPVDDNRVVFKVTADAFPEAAPGDPQVATTQNQLKTELGSSVVEQYVDALKREIGVTIDEKVMRASEGGG